MKHAYLFVRLALGLSLFGHGLVRLPKLGAFSTWMVGVFEKSMLPAVLVAPFSYALPIAEFLAGALVLLGLFTKQGLQLAGLICLALIFGTTLIENWEALPSQMIHIAFVAFLLANIKDNSFSLDKGAK